MGRKCVIQVQKDNKIIGNYFWYNDEDSITCLDMMRLSRYFINHYNKYLAGRSIPNDLLALRIFEEENEFGTLNAQTFYPKLSTNVEAALHFKYPSLYHEKQRSKEAGNIIVIDENAMKLNVQGSYGHVLIDLDNNVIITAYLYEFVSPKKYVKINKLDWKTFSIESLPKIPADPFLFHINELEDIISFLKENHKGFTVAGMGSGVYVSKEEMLKDKVWREEF